MSTCSWNCQGVGQPWKIQFLSDVIRQTRTNFVFLCETLCRKEKMDWLCSKLGYDGVFVVDVQGRSGGLALMWRDVDQVSLKSYSQNHIDIEVSMSGIAPWRLTGFYGEPVRNQRRRTWDLLRTLARDSNLPWCVIEDMNNITSQADTRGGANYPTWLVDGFNEIIAEVGLVDMDMVGYQYTWERGRGTENWIEMRLDRVLTSDSWLDVFPLAKLYSLEGSPSDHAAIFLEPKRRSTENRRRRFRFENAWLTEPLCYQIVKDNWEGSRDLYIMQKIKQCGERLDLWGKDVTGSFSTRIKKCKVELKQLRNKRDTQSLQRYNEVKK
ncbi:uncharacterized protein LOC141691964 [Apium graveolens]|uniref:uncharacterized protein LOC141691964 n=1 Tax=Apium graveolens TaxID=4045 RepID=UPI003D7B17AE